MDDKYTNLTFMSTLCCAADPVLVAVICYTPTLPLGMRQPSVILRAS